MNNTVTEYCPHCEGEAELESKFIPQKCNICGEKLLPCAQCHQLHTIFGCRKCPFEIENIVSVKLYKNDGAEQILEEKYNSDFEYFYDKLNEYKEKYKIIDKNILESYLSCNTLQKKYILI